MKIYNPIIPPIPASLVGNDKAEQTWNLLTSKLRSFASFDDCDLIKIERYIHYKAVYEDAHADVSVNGAFLKANNGISYKNPAFAIMNQAQAQMLKLEKEFGYKLEDVISRRGG